MKKESKDRLILKSALAILKKQVGKRCKEFAMGCYGCAAWRMIDDLESWIGLSDPNIR